jgi:hypothetical protein
MVAQASKPCHSAWGTLPVSHHEDRKDWYGSKDWGEACKMAEHGWPEGRAKIGDALAIASASHAGRALAKRYDVAGDWPDAGRAAAGDPLAMVRRSDAKRGAARVVRIGWNVTASCRVTGAEFIINRGAAVCALIDYLESNGRRVELTCLLRAKTGGRPLASANVTIKRASDPLDVDAVAFACASPAFFRRFGLALIEQTSVLVFGHGHPEAASAAEMAEFNLYLPHQFGSNPEWETPEKARAEMQRLAEAAGL